MKTVFLICVIQLLWASKPTILSGPPSPIGPAYSDQEIEAFLGQAVLPSGLRILDTQQTVANIANALNTNTYAKQSSHSGYSVLAYEPAAWLGNRRQAAVKKFQTFGLSDVNDSDRLPVLRVHVSPDTPQYVTAVGAANAHSVEHVVLRSIDKSVVVQPVSIKQLTSQIQNGFGAKLRYNGAMAVFSLTDLDKVRSNSPSRDFFITIIGSGKYSNRDFRVKPKHFSALGD